MEHNRAEDTFVDSLLASKLSNRLLSRRPAVNFAPEFLSLWAPLPHVWLLQTSLLFYLTESWFRDHITTEVLPNEPKPNHSTRLKSFMQIEESSFMGPMDTPGQSNNNKATSEEDLEFSPSSI